MVTGEKRASGSQRELDSIQGLPALRLWSKCTGRGWEHLLTSQQADGPRQRLCLELRKVNMGGEEAQGETIRLYLSSL